MLTPIPNQNFPTNGSSKLIEFRCSCGRTNVYKKWKYFMSGHTKNCGKCNLMSTLHFKETKYGKLRMRVPHEFHKNSHTKVTWICDCGKETSLSINDVTTGNTSSCGKCNMMSALHFKETKYGKLRMRDPISIHAGSKQKVWWICDCGKEFLSSISNITRGLTKSCGKCNLLTAKFLKNKKFGKLSIKDQIDVSPGSEKITTWTCDCGNETKAKICYVINGDTKSCGKCNIIKQTKFGRLQLKNSIKIHANSHQKPIWICDCGTEIKASVYNVTQGRTSTCGKCFERAMDWYANFKNEILKLKVPILPEKIPLGFLVAKSVVLKTGQPFEAICGACKSIYRPAWDNIRLGKSLTCGCCTYRVSKGQREIADFIKSLEFEVELEYKVENLTYDIYVPSHRLLIEYNGLRWHSMTGGQKRDLTKYQHAINNKYELISIFEDEWLLHKHKVENLLQNKLVKLNQLLIRPKNCEIRLIEAFEADFFYEQFHYIGKCKAKINYGVYFENKLVACISFKHPTRQSKYEWELVRMASNPIYRIHGIWSKLLKLFIKRFNPNSIVSFSDNRLFSGKVYSKMGFQFDGEIRPDYYWVKGQKRYHKSGLRKTKEEIKSGFTEYQLREAQGYTRIWDLGKKRWIYKS